VLGGRLTAGSFAVVLMIAIVLAHAPMLRGPAGSTRGTRDETRLMRRAVLGLLAGTAAAQVLLNVGPILLSAAAVEPGTAGAFQSTFSLARIPLFLLVPLQGAVVAPLAGLVAEGRTARMTALMLRLALGIAAVGLVGAGVAYLIGPWAVELVFGAGRSLPAPDVALLVLGVCVHAGLVLTAGALIAAERHVRASVAWVAAVVLFGLASALLWVPLGPVRAVAVAFLVSSLLGWLLALTELVAVGRRAAAGTAEAHRAE
jgi:O-antigen/teichoic acid export membrane protein